MGKIKKMDQQELLYAPSESIYLVYSSVTLENTLLLYTYFEDTHTLQSSFSTLGLTLDNWMHTCTMRHKNSVHRSDICNRPKFKITQIFANIIIDR